MSDNDQTSNIDEEDGSTADRFLRHKIIRRAHGLEPLTWSEWLAAGQPLSDDG